MLSDPDSVLTKARENLNRWSGMHRSDGMTVGYFQQWQRVLEDGLRQVEALDRKALLGIEETIDGRCEEAHVVAIA